MLENVFGALVWLLAVLMLAWGGYVAYEALTSHGVMCLPPPPAYTAPNYSIYPSSGVRLGTI